MCLWSSISDNALQSTLYCILQEVIKLVYRSQLGALLAKIIIFVQVRVKVDDRSVGEETFQLPSVVPRTANSYICLHTHTHKTTNHFPAYWGEPERAHTGQTASPAMFICIYLSMFVCIVRHSVNKCPHVLIHWTASILQCVINSVNATTFK